VRAAFAQIVNMTPREIEQWHATEESRSVGQILATVCPLASSRSSHDPASSHKRIRRRHQTYAPCGELHPSPTARAARTAKPRAGATLMNGATIAQGQRADSPGADARVRLASRKRGGACRLNKSHEFRLRHAPRRVTRREARPHRQSRHRHRRLFRPRPRDDQSARSHWRDRHRACARRIRRKGARWHRQYQQAGSLADPASIDAFASGFIRAKNDILKQRRSEARTV
jgi:hypothetical protein